MLGLFRQSAKTAWQNIFWHLIHALLFKIRSMSLFYPNVALNWCKMLMSDFQDIVRLHRHIDRKTKQWRILLNRYILKPIIDSGIWQIYLDIISIHLKIKGTNTLTSDCYRARSGNTRHTNCSKCLFSAKEILMTQKRNLKQC